MSLHGSRGTLSLFKAGPFSGSGTRESLGISFGKREAKPGCVVVEDDQTVEGPEDHSETE